jgi:hydroxymethylglutaryl-CoA lyase
VSEGTISTSFPPAVDVREVGPRDGLQPERPVDVADRIRLVHALQDAGVRHIEAAAFVSPKAVPAMAGAAEVMAGIDRRDDVTYAALVPNVKGAELALAAGIDELTVTISASEGYNRSNVRMSVAESELVIGRICAQAGGVPVDAVVSCAFGSPYEGDLPLPSVVSLGERLLEAGCARVTWADTTGMATPTRVGALLDALEGGGAAADVGLHLHDTRGTALVNAYVALARGVARFDTAVGGLGGSPFAPGATGNLATEELVALLDDLGVTTGIGIESLMDVAALVGELVGRSVPGRLAAAGPRTRLAGET